MHKRLFTALVFSRRYGVYVPRLFSLLGLIFNPMQRVFLIMTEGIVSNLGSIASIIGLFFVFREKSSTQLVKILVVLVVVLSCSTSYLIQKNSRYESAQYKTISKSFYENMKQRNIEREARYLLSKFPSFISEQEPGQNEGIVYAVLRFLESNKESYPELYLQFKMNILSDLEKAKGLRGTLEHQKIMKSAARASYQLLTSMSGNKKSKRLAGGL